MWPLNERVVVITGASSGIGRATALAAARAGAQVAIAARRQSRLHALAGDIRRMGRIAHVFPVDLADHAAATWLVDAVIVRLKRIDVLVNNAGYALHALIEDGHPDDFERLFAVNVISPLAAMRAAIPTMRKQREGHIVNVASLAAARGLPSLGVYCATKAALVRATEAVRLELRGSGVRASVVSPGLVTGTEFGEAMQVGDPARPPRRRRFRFRSPSAEDVAEVIMTCVRTGAGDVTIPRAGRLAFAAGMAPGLADLALSCLLKD
ncbi:MAG: SDR family NAD(P)-dependent oxidoreductase [Chloroflexota bacterium]